MLFAPVVVGLLVHALRRPDPAAGAAVVGVGFLVGSAAAAIGGFLGFIFGLPRSTTPAGDDTGGKPDKLRSGLRYQPNTNLEQVSDWLTKVLVGAGLTQLGALGSGFRSLTDHVGPAVGGGRAGAVVAGAVIAYAAVAGFMLAFLTTRIYLAGALTSADANALRRQREHVEALLASMPDDTPGPIEPEADRTTRALSETELADVQRQVSQLEEAGERLDDVSYRRLARELLKSGRYLDAVAAYRRAFELNPKDPAPLNYAGAVYSKYLGDYARAEGLYRQALGVAPDYVSPVYNLACNAMRKGDRGAAFRLLAAAIAADRRYAAMAERDAAPTGPFEPVADDPEFRRLTGG